MAAELKKPEFVAVDTLKPVTDGHNLRVKVVELVLAVDKTCSDGTRARRAEAIVGDQSASIVFTLRDDQIDACVPGSIIEVRNAKIEMFLGFMRLAVDKWGKIIPVPDATSFDVNTAKNLSNVEYELVDKEEEQEQDAEAGKTHGH